MPLAAQPGFPAFVIGCATLVQLAAGRALLAADETRAYFAGHALDLRCAFRAATGLPCPTCGLTRSVAMSLHGEWLRAWKLAPAGPVAVIGLVGFALAMLALAVLQNAVLQNGGGARAAAAREWIRKSALAYAAALTIVWLGGWAVGFNAALAAR
jgi:hypothetical protein